MTHPEPWPLRHLVLRTPRLELRPDDDAGLLDGTATAARRGKPAEDVRLRLPPEAFARPGWTLQVDGLDACRPLLAL
jgi:hypothetical protein